MPAVRQNTGFHQSGKQSAVGGHGRVTVAARQDSAAGDQQESLAMLMTLVVVLLVLWLLGVVTSYTLGGLLHILLVIAIVFLLIRVIRGGTL
jgi:hypothetical protein